MHARPTRRPLTLLLLSIAAACGGERTPGQQQQTPQLQLSGATLALDEGGPPRTFSVSLSAASTTPITVHLASDDPGAATLSPEVLTFEAGDLGRRTVTVSPADDDDARDERTAIALTAEGLSAARIEITVKDDDVQRLILEPASARVTEGRTATVTVRLAARPDADVTVALSAGDAAALGVSPASLTFAAGSLDAQQVSLRGLPDDDAADASTELRASASGLDAAAIPVTVVDDDTLNLDVTPAEISAREGGRIGFSVALTHRPEGMVQVALTASSTAVTLSTSSLTFDRDTWSTPQSVLADAMSDDDTEDERVTITASSPGLTSRTVSMLVMDGDRQEIVVSTSSVALAEGGDARVSVRLRFRPGAPLQVMVSSADPGAVSVAPAMLTFTPSSWNLAQDVLLHAEQDLDVAAEQTTVAFVSGSLVEAVAVDVADDDRQALVVAPSALTIDERGTATFTVALAFRPSAAVTVAITSTSGAAAASPATLTFDPSSYAAPQTVTVSGTDDADTMDAEGTVTASAAAIAPVRVRVEVRDDDVQSLLVSPANLALTEGGADGMVQVRLAFRPDAPVEVTITSTDPGAASASPGNLVFAPADYDTPRTVLVSPLHDLDTAAETLAIEVRAEGLADRDVAVRVADDDVQALVLGASSLAVDEGGSASFTVRLAFDPVTPVVVDLSSADPGAAAVAPESLRFDTGNWAVPQAITVSALQDVDLAGERLDVSARAGALSGQVAITVRDDDRQSIVVSEPSLEIREGAQATLQVSLAFQPAGLVTVQVGATDPAIASAAPTTLTFAPGSYDRPQQVTVTGVQDVDLADEQATVTLAAPGVDPIAIRASVLDDDQQRIVLGSTGLALVEGGAPGTFTAALAFQPAADVLVELTSADTTLSPGALVFSPATWSVAQTVTVNARQDDDTAGESGAIVARAAGLPAATLPVTIADDDRQAVLVSQPMLQVTEGGAVTFTVRLAFDPLADASVRLTASDPSAIAVTPAVLSFGTASWSTPQTVTVAGVADADLLDESAALTLALAGAADVPVPVAVDDDDVQALVVSPAALGVNEGGSQSFSVALAYMPAASVSVVVSAANPNVATVSRATLTFTPADYAVPQAVAVTGVDDADAVDSTTTVSLSATGIAPASLPVTVTDDDSQAILVDTTNLPLVEGGAAGSFGVRLAFAPAANVTVALASSDTGAATVSPASLTFTPGNYASPQSVTVTPAADDDTAAELVVVSASAAGLTTRQVAVPIADDDVQAIVASATNVQVAEGATATFGVRLAFDPRATVQVAIASSDPGAASVSPATLTFDGASWSVPQLVTIAGVNDADLRAENVTLTLSSPAASSVMVQVAVSDDDVQSLVVAPASVPVAEGASASFTVALAFQPAGDVTVGVTSGDTGAATVNVPSLVFTPLTYSTPQEVVVTGVQDADLADENVVVSVASAGLATRAVPVAVDDDDLQAIVLGRTSIAMVEGGATATFGVNLTFMPAADTQVTITSADTGAVAVSPAVLVFTPADYLTPRAVTVTAVSDGDLDDETVTVSASAQGALTRQVTVTVDDDDTQSIVATPGSVTVIEGRTATFGVRLAAPPVAALVVNVAALDPSVATAAPATLTFDAGNFAVAQNVTVTGVDDADLADEGTTVSLSATGVAALAVPVTVTDDDQQGIVVSTRDLVMTEGTTRTFTVRLGAPPANDVTVTITSADATAAAVDLPALTFGPGNWSVPRTVTVAGVGDPDLANEVTSLTLASAGLPPVSIAVAVTDDDVQAFVITPGSVNLVEGGTQVVNVRLAFQPAADTTIVALSSDAGAVSVTPASVAITAATYDVPRTFVISAVADRDALPESAVVTFSGAAPAATLPVGVVDDDMVVGTYNVPGQPATLSGAIAANGEVDVYRLMVSAPAYLRAETFVPSVGACNLDTVVWLLDASGATLGTDDDGGLNLCSLLEPLSAPVLLMPGTYYLAVEEYGSNAPIPAYQLVLTTVAANACGNGVLEGTETCDDGNTTSGDGCNATCGFEGQVEAEPNGTFATANVIPGTTGAVTGRIEPVADLDTFAIDAPAGYLLEASLSWNGLVTCPLAQQGRIELYNAAGALIAVSTMVGSACPRIDPTLTQAAVGLSGRYYLRVVEVGNDAAIARWYLRVRLVAPGCANGYRDAGEQCDDGNLTPGDGCDAQCQVEVVATIMPPGGIVTVPLPGTRSSRVVRVVLTAPGQSITATASDALCSLDTQLALEDASYATLGTDDVDGPGTCAAIRSTDAFASELPPGTYHLRVTSQAAAGGNTTLAVGVRSARCGNGVVERSVGETCDDGNTSDGDGCSPACTAAGVLLEVEPNGTAQTAQATGWSGAGSYVATGRLAPASGDGDFYAFTLAAPLVLDAVTYGTLGNVMTCEGDTQIFVRNAAGTIVAQDDDTGFGSCSQLTGVPLAAGAYTLEVRPFSAAVNGYYLGVTLR